MSKARRVWVQWKCGRCNRSYKYDIYGHFKVKSGWGYTYEWKCDKCGKMNFIKIRLDSYSYWHKGD